MVLKVLQFEISRRFQSGLMGVDIGHQVFLEPAACDLVGASLRGVTQFILEIPQASLESITRKGGVTQACQDLVQKLREFVVIPAYFHGDAAEMVVNAVIKIRESGRVGKRIEFVLDELCQ